MTDYKFNEIKVLENNINEKVELINSNLWANPVKKIDLTALKKTLSDCSIPHILARVEWDDGRRYHVGYVAYIPSKYKNKAPTGALSVGTQLTYGLAL